MSPVDRQALREALQDELATIREINASLRMGGMCAEELGDLYEARSHALLEVRRLLSLLRPPMARRAGVQ
ncbi:MAG TPA: hypothetical protein VG892_13725 [Terriglobales bacterium]|nr:hypothetical protein [Terriglobales bacterium]